MERKEPVIRAAKAADLEVVNSLLRQVLSVHHEVQTYE